MVLIVFMQSVRNTDLSFTWDDVERFLQSQKTYKLFQLPQDKSDPTKNNQI